MVALIVVALQGHLRAEEFPLSLDDFSPAFLGMYRKLMELEPEIGRHAERYGIDVDVARAVCLYESGGNAGLASHAGAQGYFQVMPHTFRELNVSTNIEAGVKYLAQMIRQFGREDRAVAAYNGGPGRIGRGGGVPLETLQYVIGVGHYRTVLKQYDASLRHHASRIRLTVVGHGDDWSTLSERLGLPVWELRLHNAFLAGRPLRFGERVAYPPEPRGALIVPDEDGWTYRMRHGDNYISLAITLGLGLDSLREANGLWHTQAVPAGTLLRIPAEADRSHVARAASAVQPTLSPRLEVMATERGHASSVSSESSAAASAVKTSAVPRPGRVVRVSRASVNPSAVSTVKASTITYTVKRGDTLARLAQRHGTTIAAIRRANTLQGSMIHEGQVLRVPVTRARPVRADG